MDLFQKFCGPERNSGRKRLRSLSTLLHGGNTLRHVVETGCGLGSGEPFSPVWGHPETLHAMTRPVSSLKFVFRMLEGEGEVNSEPYVGTLVRVRPGRRSTKELRGSLHRILPWRKYSSVSPWRKVEG